MGLLVNGVWRDVWYDTESTGGRFERQASQFRGRVSADGSSGFPVAAGRYHLYVSYACPWAHRTLIARSLLGLEGAIDVSVVNPVMLEHGWTFAAADGVTPDPVGGARFLYEVYLRADPGYSGRVTVPVVWDLERGTIVNNESADILRMMGRELSVLGSGGPELCPPALEDAIDEVNAFVYDAVNDGVYRAGFATTQEAYEEAAAALFEALDALEARLEGQRYLVGEVFTEADIRLFTTLIRFDTVYHVHFKCNRRRIVDYPALWGYVRDLYQMPGVAATVRFDHIARHYYRSHRTINPTGIVPIGPELDLDAPHGRERLAAPAPPGGRTA